MISSLQKQRLRRPVSPHLTIYKWRYQSLASILQRVSGMCLSGGLYAFAATYVLLPQVAAVDVDVGTLAAVVGAWPAWVKVPAKFVLAWPFAYHAANGGKQLVFDAGVGMSRAGVVRASRVVAGCSVVGACALCWV